ncbi:unnamed protein product [Caenorhabditis brenneri]
MKLFKYPVLVFDNIIVLLDTIPLVSLSFCSRKTRDRIKRVRFAIEEAWFGNVVHGYEGYFLEVILPKTSNSLVVDSGFITRKNKLESKNFNIQIGDVSYDCRYLEEGHSIYLGTTDYKAFIFFNYFLDLVRTGITEITLDLERLDDVKQFISNPCFQNVQYICLEGESVPARKVTELYDCLEKPVLETYVESKIRALRPTSKLLQSENLLLGSSKLISIEHLLNFTGKYIRLNYSSLREEQIVAFVKHWLNGNYPNLEGAEITCPMRMRLRYDTEKVLNEFNTKRWNPAERAQHFIFKASFYRYEKNGFPKIDCSNGYDIERDDGLLATILYQTEENSLYLGTIGYKKVSLFISYILDLVRTGVTLIEIDLKRLDNVKKFISEPCFQNVQKIYLEGKTVPAKKVMELYDCLEKPVLETYVESNIRALSPTSKLLHSENLSLNSSKFISIEHLLNFTGKYIRLYYSSLREEQIVAFVKHWLDGNYPNLEGAKITTLTDIAFETEKVLDEFNTKQWNPAERAQNFILKASFYRNEKNEFPKVDCSNGYDLERNDGLMATILFGEHNYYFDFYVWHNRFP